MSFKNRHTTLGLLLAIIVFLIIDSFVVIRFFTDDKLEEVTFSQASSNDYNNTISTQLAKLETPESFVFPEIKKSKKFEDDFQITNDTKVDKVVINSQGVIANASKDTVPEITETTSSRSSVDRKKVDDSEKKVSETSTSNNTEQISKSESNISSSKIPAGQTSIGTIEIPKTNVNLPILSNITVSGMEVATCLMYSTGSLNVNGTTVIIGHNYCNGKLFSNNNKLQKGDKIFITTTNGNKREYTIYDKFITTDEDISYLERNKTNEPQIALSTCTNNEEKRLVILAK